MNEITTNYHASLYLAFRYVVNLQATQPKVVLVNSSEEMFVELRNITKNLLDPRKVGIFLSGGVDSGIIAKFLSAGTHAFTINFKAKSDVDEGAKAEKYVLENDLIHHIVEVTWEDYEMYESDLMKNKNAPLHPLEVALYKAALAAKEEGLDTIVTGTGADSNFGGMDELLSEDWTFDEFINRYTFVDPAVALKNPHNIREIYEPYRSVGGINCAEFLREVHCVEQQRAFYNAITLAGLSFVAPFTKMNLRNSLDIRRIRSGEPKYLVFEIFRRLYPNLVPPKKVPFTRPMEEWLVSGFKIKSSIFLEGLNVNNFSGEQKYLLHCLDRFVGLLNFGDLK